MLSILLKLKFCKLSVEKVKASAFLLLFVVPSLIPFTTANAAEECSDEFYINQTLPNGARWDMCWEHRQREGITFSAVHYTPKDGTRRMILNHAAIAQIHVPYDDNGTRFHDVSDFGIGGENLLDLIADECPSGTIYPISYTVTNEDRTSSEYTKNGLCKQVKKNDIGFKSGSNTEQQHYLNVFNVSPVGAYYYIPTWKFMDDGTIEPWMGATGALQRYNLNETAEEESRGWLMGSNAIGIAHLHNFYWKLDFDLNSTHLDDVVEEVNFVLNNGKRNRQTTVFNTEVARKVNPTTMRYWRVRDNNAKNTNGHSISYDILLNESGHEDIGPASEPFTENDFYVTKQNNQERFASHNTSGGANLAEFVNNEAITDNDIVVWAGITFYHMPRSEDAPQMDVHWSHLKIVPRDLSATNSLSNSEPQLTNIANQATELNQSISLNVQASDANGDLLSYSANGLPTGLSINSNTGQITGAPNQLGNYSVQVNVSDGQVSASTQFDWTITSETTGTSDSGGGSMNPVFLFLMVFVAFLQRRFRLS